MLTLDDRSVAPAAERFAIPGGELEIRVRQADIGLADLCAFAARRNSRRGFLVVSRVLGRHLPARPSIMRAAVEKLAAKLPIDLPGPVAFVGLAETAVSLGESVWEGWTARTGRTDAVFIPTSRLTADRPLWARFEEPHSHAPAHLIHTPQPQVAQTLAFARSLVLVDDEITSGTTLKNLAAAMKARSPAVERTVAVCLTDWSPGHSGLERVSLLTGELRWRPSVDEGRAPPEPALAAAGFGRAPTGAGARFGRSRSRALEAEVLAQARWAEDGRPLLVLGVGEFAHAPFRLAEALERDGLDVRVQVASRSPIQTGGVIEDALAFADPYGSGAEHYVYNPVVADERQTLVCCEPAHAAATTALARRLNGRAIIFGPES